MAVPTKTRACHGTLSRLFNSRHHSRGFAVFFPPSLSLSVCVASSSNPHVFFFFFFSISVNGAGWCDDVNEADAPEWAESSSSGNSASLIADADFEVMPTEVRVASGTTAYLSCRPRSLRNKTVISSRWMVCKSMSLFAPRPYYCVCYLNASVNTSWWKWRLKGKWWDSLRVVPDTATQSVSHQLRFIVRPTLCLSSGEHSSYLAV